MEPIPGKPLVWTESVTIRSYDVDFTRRASPESVCRHFLDAAWNHAEALGFGFTHLAGQGKFWVLSRLLLEFRERPLWGSTAVLRTWPRTPETVFALRDFELASPEGRILAAGSSAWLVLDAASKRPQRLSKVLPRLAGLSLPSALGRDPEKLPENNAWEQSFSATVRYTDIDVNRHVNSAAYIGWLLDSYPGAFHAEHSLEVLEVNYLGETLLGEVVTARMRRTNDTGVFSHSLTKNGSDEVCRARLSWKTAKVAAGAGAENALPG